MSRRELDLLAFSLYALAYKPQFCATVLCLAALAVFRASFVPRHKLRERARRVWDEGSAPCVIKAGWQ